MAPGLKGVADRPADDEPVTPARRYRFDASWHRLDDTRVLAGSPVSMFRVTAAGAGVLDRLERGEALAENSLVARLVDAGAIHPVVDTTTGRARADDVTVVTPTYRRPGSVVTGSAGPGRSTVPHVVVDDASPEPVVGATLRLSTNVGPAAARNAGRRAVDTSFVAFVDDDVELEGDGGIAELLAPLLAHFDDPRVALVAPRIVGDPPLDLGERAARVRSGSRVPYVPAALVVVRTAAFDDVGGFDETLRFGEDVDLVWRLDDAGWRCRYEPDVVVRHRRRSTIGERVRQHAGYGSSAAPLALRHPTRLAPWQGDPGLAAVAAATVVGVPGAAVAAVSAQLLRLHRRLPGLAPKDSVPLVLRADADAVKHLARAVRRVWWPIALPLSLVSRRVRRATLAAFLLAPVAAVDDVAYGWGVWVGMRRTRSWRPLVPRLVRGIPPSRPG